MHREDLERQIDRQTDRQTDRQRMRRRRSEGDTVEQELRASNVMGKRCGYSEVQTRRRGKGGEGASAGAEVQVQVEEYRVVCKEGVGFISVSTGGRFGREEEGERAVYLIQVPRETCYNRRGRSVRERARKGREEGGRGGARASAY